MKRKNHNVPCCVICKTRNHRAGFGISFGSGAHICMECAESIHDLMEDLYEEHKVPFTCREQYYHHAGVSD